MSNAQENAPPSKRARTDAPTDTPESDQASAGAADDGGDVLKTRVGDDPDRTVVTTFTVDAMTNRSHLSVLLNTVPETVTHLVIKVPTQRIRELYDAGLGNVTSLEIVNRGMFHRDFVRCFDSPYDFKQMWPDLERLTYRGGVSVPNLDSPSNESKGQQIGESVGESVSSIVETFKKWSDDDSTIDLIVERFVCACSARESFSMAKSFVKMLHREGFPDTRITQGF